MRGRGRGRGLLAVSFEGEDSGRAVGYWVVSEAARSRAFAIYSLGGYFRTQWCGRFRNRR